MRNDWFPIDEHAHARSGDPSTSHEAAASVVKITEKQQKVLVLFLSHGPMHDEQLIPLYHDWARQEPDACPQQADSGIRSRRSELYRKGFLVKTGRKARTRANRRADIYEARTPPPYESPLVPAAVVPPLVPPPVIQLSLLDG